MLSKHQIQELFNVIYQLRSDITLKFLHRRIQKHHQSKRTDSSHDITKHLNEQVHHLVNKHQEATSKVTWKKSTFIIKNRHQVTTLDDYKSPNAPNIINPLRDYLKNKKYHDSSHAGVAEKLISSTWDHFRAAIREARRGKLNSAKMHVDIANYAMREAKHFLPEKDYQDFYSEIKVEIKELRKLHLQSE